MAAYSPAATPSRAASRTWCRSISPFPVARPIRASCLRACWHCCRTLPDTIDGADMPEAVVRGIHINYEIIGNSGAWIALTPGSRRSYGELVDLSKAIAANGYRVLLHDRRNCGASDVAFDGSGSGHEVLADR